MEFRLEGVVWLGVWDGVHVHGTDADALTAGASSPARRSPMPQSQPPSRPQKPTNAHSLRLSAGATFCIDCPFSLTLSERDRHPV